MMDIIQISVIGNALVLLIIVGILFFGRKSGWFALLFALFGCVAIGFSIWTDFEGITIALNSLSALMFLAWIIAINRKGEGGHNDSSDS